MTRTLDRRQRRIKIIATLGPDSFNRERLTAFVEAGADVFRINMSHGGREQLPQRVAIIREVEQAVGRPIGILVDLQGPKLRIDRFAEGRVTLKAGDRFVFDAQEKPGDAHRVRLPHPEILRALEAGHAVLLDDGKLRMRVLDADGTAARLEVIVGGVLSDRKGISLPDTVIPVSAMTEKDHGDLEAALDTGVDWIALSFVQRPEDLADVRKTARGRALVLAKIEKPQAVARLAEIIEASDALMVARGDLGVEMPLEKVPGIQKRIIRECRLQGKPVVIATQMLESMIENPVPTRAEVSDVATAVFEGADAVMLSAESAVGKYPIEAISMMSRIAEEVEGDMHFRRIIDGLHTEHDATTADAISAAARAVADTLDVKCIVALSQSGRTAFRVARERSQSPVLLLTSSIETARRLTLVWGVHAFETSEFDNMTEMVNRACRIARHEGFVEPGQRLMIVAGVPFGLAGTTNTIRIAVVPN